MNALAAAGCLCVAAAIARGQDDAGVVCGGGVLTVDVQRMAAAGDLELSGPAKRSEAGLPIGNGRMGTLLWTTPSSLRLQINRVDVFAANRDTNSFPERHSDYCNGCAAVHIDVGGQAFGERMRQRLSCASGLATIDAEGVSLRALAAMDRDVMALEIVDRRERPRPVVVQLKMLRPAVVERYQHRATSRLQSASGRILLTQAFEERDYYCGSAVAIQVIGGGATIESADDELSIKLPAGGAPVTVLISSAASFDRDKDLASAATGLLEGVAGRSFGDLFAANRAWWHEFWDRGFAWVGGDGETARLINQSYIYYLYLMASTSRGEFPTKFNGMLWATGGDQRQWGGQYWGANQSCLYNGLLPANRWELLDPMHGMYTRMLPSCEAAARQQWGSEGAFVPETHAFDGLESLPDDVAAEMRELYLGRKAMSSATPQFTEFARMKQPHSSRWNWWGDGAMVDGQWAPEPRPEAPFGAVTHIFSRGAKIAYHFWQRYEYTQDRRWLAERAYPMLRDVAEFYRNFPNVRRGDDGRYHIYRINSNESVRDCRDADEEIAAMTAIFPTAIRASEILGVDAEMRPLWQEFSDNLAPLPRSDMPEAVEMRRKQLLARLERERRDGDEKERPRDDRRGPRRDGDDGDDDADAPPHWIRALPPVGEGRGQGRPDGNTMPMWYFDLCTLENADQETRRTAEATFALYEDRSVGVLSKVGVTAAMLGRANAVRVMLVDQLTAPDRAPVMANRLDLREGRQCQSAQRLGRAADALHNALVQSVGAGPAQDPVIRVFPAWPPEWDAAFTLLCRGNFLVTSSMRGGQIEFVVIESQVGGPCRIRNPWGGSEMEVRRGSQAPVTERGDLLTMETAAGERLILTKAGEKLERYRRVVPAESAGGEE